jgi:hypothetical protein
MKSIIAAVFFLIFSNTLNAQQASDYFPSQTGFLWNYAVTPLDSVNNPVNELTVFRRDSFNVAADYQGRSANIVTSKTGPLETIYNQPYTDSLFYSASGTDGYEYFSINNIEPFLVGLDSMGIDTNFNFVDFFSSFQNWYSVYRFASPAGTRYTLLTKDTTIATYNLRFQYSAVRRSDETISTIQGNLNCKKFLVEWTIFTFIGSFPVQLINLPDTVWIAPGNWVVQDIIPGQYIDNLTLLGIEPFSLPGRKLVLTDQITSIDKDFYQPVSLMLHQNYPNPFNPSTTISWHSPVAGHQVIKVFDVLGNEVATLVDAIIPEGYHSIEFNASGLSSGVYFYQIKSDSFIQTKKMLLVR